MDISGYCTEEIKKIYDADLHKFCTYGFEILSHAPYYEIIIPMFWFNVTKYELKWMVKTLYLVKF